MSRWCGSLKSVKIVEQPGMGIMSEVGKKHPFVRNSYGRAGCPIVISGKECNEICYKEGIVYRAECNLCTALGRNIKSEHIGEELHTLRRKLTRST